MGGGEDREVAVEQIEANAAVEGRIGNVDASEGRVHAAVDTGINIDKRIDMRDAQNAGFHEWDAEIEDIGMRVEVIGGWVDRLGAF